MKLKYEEYIAHETDNFNSGGFIRINDSTYKKGRFDMIFRRTGDHKDWLNTQLTMEDVDKQIRLDALRFCKL